MAKPISVEDYLNKLQEPEAPQGREYKVRVKLVSNFETEEVVVVEASNKIEAERLAVEKALGDHLFQRQEAIDNGEIVPSIPKGAKFVRESKKEQEEAQVDMEEAIEELLS